MLGKNKKNLHQKQLTPPILPAIVQMVVLKFGLSNLGLYPFYHRLNPLSGLQPLKPNLRKLKHSMRSQCVEQFAWHPFFVLGVLGRELSEPYAKGNNQ